MLKFHHAQAVSIIHGWFNQIQWINYATDRETLYLVLHRACEVLAGLWGQAGSSNAAPAWAIIMRPMQTSLHRIEFTTVGLRARGNIVQRHLSSSATARSASAWFTMGHADLDCPELNQHSIPAPGHPGHTQYVRVPPCTCRPGDEEQLIPINFIKTAHEFRRLKRYYVAFCIDKSSRLFFLFFKRFTLETESSSINNRHPTY